jgi:hypothetical protein
MPADTLRGSKCEQASTRPPALARTRYPTNRQHAATITSSSEHLVSRRRRRLSNSRRIARHRWTHLAVTPPWNQANPAQNPRTQRPIMLIMFGLNGGFSKDFWRFLGYPGFRLRPDDCRTASLESSTEKPFTANQSRTRKLGNARRLKTSPARNTDQMSVFETSQSDGPRLRQAFSSRLFVLGGNL